MAALGGPKIYSPRSRGRVEGQLRFTARLSVAQPWTVTVANSAGVQVAQGTGTGTAVDWTWDASLAPCGQLLVDDRRPERALGDGTLAAGAALAVQKAAAAPVGRCARRHDDGSFAVTAPATVTVNLVVAERRAVSPRC